MNYRCVRSKEGMKVQALSMNNFSSPLQSVFFYCIAFSPHPRAGKIYFIDPKFFQMVSFGCFFLHKIWQASLKLASSWKLANLFTAKAHLMFHFGLLPLCFHVQFEQKENKEKWIPFGAYLILTKSVFHAQLHQFIQFILQTALQRNHTRQLRLKLIDTETD